MRVWRIDDTGGAGDPYEDFLAERHAGARRELARGRGGDDRDQLHLGHDGPAQGRDVHLPRRVPQRDRRGHRDRDDVRQPVSLDAADVPLQRLVLHLGRHRGGRDQHLPAARRAGPDLGAARPGGRHPLLRRADGADRPGEPPLGAPAGPAGDGDRRGRAAVADAARQAARAELPPRPRLRADRDLRPAHRLRVARRVGRAARGGAGAAGRAPGPGLPDRRPRARGRRRHAGRPARRRDARRGGACAATT